MAGYNPKETLVIDPSIIFSTFTGSTTDNWGYTATPGPDGSFYAGGISFGTGYKVSPGAFQTTFSGGSDIEQIGGYDIAIFKFSPNGSNRLYATYLGGNGLEQPHSMVVDNAGNLIVAGRTTSTDYPTRAFAGNPGPGGGYDIIITKFNATGTALLGSVKVGGRGADAVSYTHLDVYKRQLEGCADGSIHVLLGTHAVIEEKVKFANLGLAVIDEQHKFGVAQRAKLWKKNSLPPHVLVMTATPIPRTLALTAYGDLDYSCLLYTSRCV